MKNTAIITVAIALLLPISSCTEDFLEAPTKSSLDESVIFSVPAYAEKAIAGVLNSFAETNSYRGRYILFYGINTDVEVRNGMTGSSSLGVEEWLVNYQTNVGNSQMNTNSGNPNFYSTAYQGIERANLAIRGLRTYGDVENNAELAQILGELLTIRAVLYSDLVKGWNSVPARFEPINSENVYLPRSDRDVILKQLLADMEEAAELVGWPGENSLTQSSEHVNKCFVKGMRARIALMAGGHSLHLGETTMRPSADPDLERSKMYQIARQECLDVINSGYAKLQPGGFEACFRAVHDEAYAAGNEILWELPFSDTRGRVIFNLGVKHTTADKYIGGNYAGSNGPNPIMFYKYEKEDVRRDVTCIPYEWTDGKQVPTNLSKWYFGKYRYEWLHRMAAADDGLNYLYMRYAEVLLMAAEAINELTGPADAAPYLRQIRERAYPNNPEKVEAFMATATASKDAFFNAVVDERALEFCGEMLRKADLIRWNLLDEKMNANKAELEKLDKREAPYDNVNEKVYYRTATNGETVQFYGLNPGETGAPPDPTIYSSKTWKLNDDADVRMYWDRVFIRTPSLQPYWPIWQDIIETSNGVLVNDPVFNS
jgi:hypothetical protein